MPKLNVLYQNAAFFAIIKYKNGITNIKCQNTENFCDEFFNSASDILGQVRNTGLW